MFFIRKVDYYKIFKKITVQTKATKAGETNPTPRTKIQTQELSEKTQQTQAWTKLTTTVNSSN